MISWNNSKLTKKLRPGGSYQNLVEKSKLDFDFAFLSLAGLAICVLGLFINSSPVIVGAMIIAPLIYSILVLPAAVAWKDKNVFISRLWSLFVELLVGVIFCMVLSYVLGVDVYKVDFITNLGQNTPVYFLVAVIAGAAAALSLFWPGVSEEITGVAISVALVPPIAVIGIAVASQSKEVLMLAAANLFLNLAGIMLGAYAIFKLTKRLT